MFAVTGQKGSRILCILAVSKSASPRVIWLLPVIRMVSAQALDPTTGTIRVWDEQLPKAMWTFKPTTY